MGNTDIYQVPEGWYLELVAHVDCDGCRDILKTALYMLKNSRSRLAILDDGTHAVTVRKIGIY